MKHILLAVTVFLFCSGFSHAETMRLVQIDLPHHDHVYQLRQYDIIDAGIDYAKALVTDREIMELRGQGYTLSILIKDYKAYKDELFERGFYHTYDQVYAVLDSFVTNYPTICRLDTIGLSVQGRAIWAMRVTDNPMVEENEPEIRLPGNMHGDEHIGTEVPLYFLRYLVENYASNSQVQALVNNREIWILPTINPDGKVANSRYNANGVDLNRNYGYFWDGAGGGSVPFSEIENQVMLQHLEENNVSLEYNYHSVAQYVNYPWDYHPADPVDSQYIVTLSQIYADSANLTVINGYAWYQITGGLQDHTIGTTGALAWTIETDEPAGSAAIDQICYENRDALMEVCERAGWGIEGIVCDSSTSSPVYARLEFLNPERIDIYSDPVLGDFHKMVQPGTYDVRVCANGYQSKTISGVTVPSSGSIDLGDILLAPDTNAIYAFRVILCRYQQHAEQSNQTQPRKSLGQQDGIYFSLGQNGYIVIDMGANSPLTNSSGDDFTVYEGDDGSDEGYEVLAGDDWNGPWYSCGFATGTASFDLSFAGISQARYVRIVDDGSSTSGQYAGFDLDAIQGTPPINAANLFIADHQINDGNNGILEPDETADLLISLENSGLLAANNTNCILRSSDIYISISDSAAFYGDILPDSFVINTGDPFTVHADSTTPPGHSAHFDVIVTADGYDDTLGLDIIVGKKHYYLWNPDPTPTPGQNCHNLLGVLGYAGDYGTSLAADLSLYQAVLVCVGIYSNNYTIASGSAEATALENFLSAGGRMYLEGGDVWYYDPLYQGGHDFGPSFGINATDDGSGDLLPVVGQSGTFTVGMNFTGYTGENNWIDHLSSTGTGYVVFVDGNNAYDCGIANDAGTYRTVGTSFELGLLTDASPPTTRAALLDSIMKFFGCQINPGVNDEFDHILVSRRTMLTTIHPNPSFGLMCVEYNVATKADVQLALYDVCGRLVGELVNHMHDPGAYTYIWDGRDNRGVSVSAGVYFLSLCSPEHRSVRKVIQIR